MSDLEVIDLYEKKNRGKSKDFIKNTNSKLDVKTEVKKTINDIEWIQKMQETIPYIDNIFRAPNRFIVNEEEIVKIELARKITGDSIKHLSKNTNLIQSIDKKTGDVRPSKILNINKEESYDTYENRLIYTLIQNMKFFVERRKKALEQMQDFENKNSKQLKYAAKSNLNDEDVEVNLSIDSNLSNDKENNKDSKNNNISEILEEIKKLEQNINILTGSEVYSVIDKKHISLVREPIKKTNVVLKNVNFQYAMKLWNYLRDNFEDKTKQIDEKNDYEDNGELKNLFDETFMLQYLAMKTLDEDQEETKETRQEIKESILEQMLDKLIDLDTNITGDELNNLIASKYEVIKYKKMKALKEIQKIFKTHIDKYIEKINK